MLHVLHVCRLTEMRFSSQGPADSIGVDGPASKACLSHSCPWSSLKEATWCLPSGPGTGAGHSVSRLSLKEASQSPELQGAGPAGAGWSLCVRTVKPRVPCSGEELGQPGDAAQKPKRVPLSTELSASCSRRAACSLYIASKGLAVL